MDSPPAFPIRADKSFGQHFLHDDEIITRILRFAAPLGGRQVIEIGPGPGALTRALLQSDAAHLHVVEIDDRMIPGLTALADSHSGHLSLHHADALSLDIRMLAPAPRVIVANLPYNVGTPLLVGWLEAVAEEGPDAFEAMTLMFQKEVAERIAAQPGSKHYGRLSVFAQWLCDVTYGFDIPPGCFTPPPKVTSGVIRLAPLPAPRFPAHRERLEALLAAAFNHRRKMLRASLKSLIPQVSDTLEALGIDPTRRPETLSVEEWCRLSTNTS